MARRSPRSEQNPILIKLVRIKHHLNKDVERQEVIITTSGQVKWRFFGRTSTNKPISVGWSNRKKLDATSDIDIKHEIRSWRGKGFHQIK